MPVTLTFLVFFFSIVQQPWNNSVYVSQNPEKVTQYSQTSENVIGLLGESNKAFYELQPGNIITVYRANSAQLYEVSEIIRYTATDPLNPAGNYIHTETGVMLTANQIIALIYTGEPARLVLQTCYDGARGRYFVIALPVHRTQHKARMK